MPSPRSACVALLVAGCQTAPATPNVVLVSFDTLRADRVGAVAGSDTRTPNLDRFAADAVVFAGAYSQSIRTGPSHASVLTSRYPVEISPTADLTTLPEVLATYGYETAAFVAGGELSPGIGPTRGFTTYQSARDFGSFYDTVPLAEAWLERRDESKPFFLFVHGYDAHTDYSKPLPYGQLHAGRGVLDDSAARVLRESEMVVEGFRLRNFEILDAVSRRELWPLSSSARATTRAAIAAAPNVARVGPRELALIPQAYDGAVAYADVWFGMLMARLQDEGALDNTILIVMSDHGEALGEKGLFHRCCGLDDAVTHVPLVIRAPGGSPGRVDALVELVDVLPTVTELVGAVAPAGVHGVSLVPALRGGTFAGRAQAISEGGPEDRMISARTATGRLTWSGVPIGSPDLVALLQGSTLGGPLWEVEGSVPDAETVRAALVTWVGTLQRASFTPAPMAPELRETIRAHGYWDAR